MNSAVAQELLSKLFLAYQDFVKEIEKSDKLHEKMNKFYDDHVNEEHEMNLKDRRIFAKMKRKIRKSSNLFTLMTLVIKDIEKVINEPKLNNVRHALFSSVDQDGVASYLNHIEKKHKIISKRFFTGGHNNMIVWVAIEYLPNYKKKK